MNSVFDILGPVMIGPSSSHTAGAVNIGRVARQIFGGRPASACITLYGSFAATYKGHGTDRALVAGILGYPPDDSRVKEALEIATREGVKVKFELERESPYHPNTVRIVLSGEGRSSDVVGVSLGGSRIAIREIDGFKVDITGAYNTLLCSYPEQVGMVARVSGILASDNINIAFMTVSRSGKRSKALMVVEVDEEIDEKILSEVASVPGMLAVKYIEKN